MDQSPDTIGYIVGGIIAGVTVVVGTIRKFGWKLFGPPEDLSKDVADIKSTVAAINRALSEQAVQEGRMDERLQAIDRRVSALERKL